MKRFAIFFSVLLISACTYAQIGVSMYSQAAGVSFFERKSISAEARLYFNKTLEDVPIELMASYNFHCHDIIEPFAGVSFYAAPLSEGELSMAIFIPGGFRLRPFKSLTQLSFLFELAPGYTSDSDFYLRGLWGVRYTFANDEE